MRAESSARVFQRQNTPRHAQIAIIRRFWKELRDISIPFEIIPRLNALFTPFYMQNVVHAFSSDETSPDNRNHSPILTKIKRNFYPVCDISTLKRYVHCIMRAESSARVFQRRNRPRHAQIAIIRRFWKKLRDISIPFEIIPRLNALFTPFYIQKVVHAFSSDETSPDTRNHSPILTKIKRNFYPVWDISTFKRSLHCIVRAERSARVFQRRNKPGISQIAMIRRF